MSSSPHPDANPQQPHPLRDRLAHALLSVYKSLFAPVLHSFGLAQCRFLPTCSEYAYAAIVRHGWIRGLWLALRRLARCHPWGSSGFDPVP
jgi:putative membrane protein insertion efficiency factor